MHAGRVIVLLIRILLIIIIDDKRLYVQEHVFFAPVHHSAATSPARVSTREPDQPTASSATAAAVPLPRRSAARNQRKAHHTGLVARLVTA